MRTPLRRGLFVAAAFLAAAGPMMANIINARSVAEADVLTAVALSKDGDVVNVPAGMATWTSSFTISKNITLQGAGAAATIIVNGIAGPSSRPPLIEADLARDLPFRLTGFTFKGGSATAENYNGEIRIRGISHAFRVDHCTLDFLHGTQVATYDFSWGVIDHCLFNTDGPHPITIDDKTWNGQDHGHGSWADDPYWGSEKFVFIEDNVFESTGATGLDSFEGARFVVRHNQMHNVGLTCHGTEGQGRGAKEVEEYNNTYRFDNPGQAGQIRSGCLITHDNTWTNVAKGHILQAYRFYHYSAYFGLADGQNPYDNNAPNGTVGYWQSGKHTGPSGSTNLTDSSKQWSANEWYQPGATFIVRNMTQETAARVGANRRQSFAVSNTATTIDCSGLFFNPPRLTFNPGDSYQLWKVVRSLDQPGSGKTDLMTGLPASPAKWPHQVTEPCYSWNNTSSGQPRNLASTEPSIQEGRDFFNGTVKPGYTTYVYPHPLVSGNPVSPTPTPAPTPTPTATPVPSATPNPPTNLRIVPGS